MTTPVTTPLTTLADGEVTAAGAAAGTLAKRLATVDAQLPGLHATLNTATAAVVGDVKAVADLRRRLGQIPLPADSEPLVTDLEVTLVAIQHDRAAADAATDALATAQRQRARIAAELAAATAAAATLTRTATASHAGAEQVAAWLVAATGPAVAAAVNVASHATSGQPYTAARDRLAAIVDPGGGSTMMDLFRRRSVEADERDAALRSAVDAAWTARQSLRHPGEDTLAAAQRAYGRAVADVSDVADNAVARIDAALKALDAAAQAPDPTAAESGAIAVAHTDAATAAPLEVAVHDAARALRQARATLDTAALTQIQSDPLFDPDTAPQVATQRQDVATAVAALQQARSQLAGGQESLDTFEASLPDDVKDRLVDFLAAEAALAAVTALNPTALASTANAAAATLAAALRAGHQRDASIARLDAELADRGTADTAWSAVAGDRRAALIRGEG